MMKLARNCLSRNRSRAFGCVVQVLPFLPFWRERGTFGAWHPLSLPCDFLSRPSLSDIRIKCNACPCSSSYPAEYLNKAIWTCKMGGFKRIRMRGDCKFSQTEYLDGWDVMGVRFQFGYEARRISRKSLTISVLQYGRSSREQCLRIKPMKLARNLPTSNARSFANAVMFT